MRLVVCIHVPGANVCYTFVASLWRAIAKTKPQSAHPSILQVNAVRRHRRARLVLSSLWFWTRRLLDVLTRLPSVTRLFFRLLVRCVCVWFFEILLHIVYSSLSLVVTSCLDRHIDGTIGASRWSKRYTESSASDWSDRIGLGRNVFGDRTRRWRHLSHGELLGCCLFLQCHLVWSSIFCNGFVQPCQRRFLPCRRQITLKLLKPLYSLTCTEKQKYVDIETSAVDFCSSVGSESSE